MEITSTILVLLMLGLVFVVISGLIVMKLLGHEKFRWPITGVVVAYWALYIVGIIMVLAGGRDEVVFEGLQQIGGVTLLGLGLSAGLFYLFVIWSYKSLLKKVSGLKNEHKHAAKISRQHARAMIVFFFTTWVAAGFVYLIHHRATLVLREAKRDKTLTPEEVDSKLSEVFGREINWEKKKRKSREKKHS